MRGDVAGMFIFFVIAFLGAWQFIVAAFRLNGLSLTGYPDRKWLSGLLGGLLVAGACTWYFSRPGHFASPDVEGIETFIVLTGGLIVATVAQAIMASVITLLRRRRSADARAPLTAEDFELEVAGARVTSRFVPAIGKAQAGCDVLLLHDFGGTIADLDALAAALAQAGHCALAVELDGHGNSPREITSASMDELLDAAAAELRKRNGDGPVNAVGAGFGGHLAIELARRGTASRAVAIDPPARDAEGYSEINAMRESTPVRIVTAFFKPPARGTDGKRSSLSRLLHMLPPPEQIPSGSVTVLGTSERWLNRPTALEAFAASIGSDSAKMLVGTHSSLPDSKEAIEEVLAALA